MNNMTFVETIQKDLSLRDSLQKEYKANQMIFTLLKTANATPDIPFIKCLNTSNKNWTKILSPELVYAIIIYSETPTEERKDALMQQVVSRNSSILYKIRELNLSLNIHLDDIETKLSTYDVKIEEIKDQISRLTERIGEISSEKEKLVELQKKI